MSDRIRILIADDHTIVREGLRTMLKPKPDMDLIGEATDGAEAVEKAAELRPDVILMDLLMPRKSGLDAIREIIQANPAIHILVLTSFSEEDRVIEAIKAGSKGYVLKDSSPQELIQAIRDVHAGKLFLFPGMTDRIIQKLIQPEQSAIANDDLTEREVEVLRLVAQGLSNQDIADRLKIGEGTARFHVNNILTKLGLSNRTQAALYALRKGLASLY
ncbi:MAG: response regulator transcription factor [Chloroflexi bacterium]|nr:response regulator transcription factor [Chloroflexota bacterium]